MNLYEIQARNKNTGCLDIFLITELNITFAYIKFSEEFEEEYHDQNTIKVIKLEELDNE